MKNKYFYAIFKLKIKPWIKYWLIKKDEFKGKLSEILTGFTFNLQNTLRQKFVKFDIQGNSIQDGEPSPEHEQPIKSSGDNVNLFDKELFGTFTSSIQNIQVQLKPNTQYIMSSNIPASSGVANLFAFENGSSAQSSVNGVSNNTSRTITTGSDGIVVIAYRNYNNSLDNYNPKEDFWYKLEQGTVVTPYSPYGMGSISEKIYKEMLNQDNISKLDGYINTDNLDIRTSTVSKSLYFQINGGYTYTVSKTLGNRLRVGCSVNVPAIGGTCLSTYNADNGVNKIKITTPSNAKYLLVTYYNSSVDTLYTEQEILDSITIESSEFLQSYSIYTQQPMRSIGDVRDDFVKQDGVWFERHKITKIVLNGSENWQDRPNYNYWDRFVMGSNIPVQSVNGLSNYFKVSKVMTDNEICMWENAGNQLGVNFSTKGTTTLEQFKTWLSNHNTELLYIPTTPTDLPCTEEQITILENLPITYEGQTNIYSTDEVEPYLEIQYWEEE